MNAGKMFQKALPVLAVICFSQTAMAETPQSLYRVRQARAVTHPINE